MLGHRGLHRHRTVARRRRPTHPSLGCPPAPPAPGRATRRPAGGRRAPAPEGRADRHHVAHLREPHFATEWRRALGARRQPDEHDADDRTYKRDARITRPLADILWTRRSEAPGPSRLRRMCTAVRGRCAGVAQVGVDADAPRSSMDRPALGRHIAARLSDLFDTPRNTFDARLVTSEWVDD